MNPDVSPEELKNLTEFNKELSVILDKYGYDLGAIAFLLPDGRIAARPQCFKRQNQEQGVSLNQPVQAVDNHPVN